jgi:KaiC/GvpD/RAD55 family RecA-like ATPase
MTPCSERGERAGLPTSARWNGASGADRPVGRIVPIARSVLCDPPLAAVGLKPSASSSRIVLPHELRQFFSGPGPQTLLVRGAPGSGKTTFALSLLELFAGQRFYISGRVRPSDLARSFPWLPLTRVKDPWKVLDLSSSPSSAEEAARLSVLVNRVRQDHEDRTRNERLWLPGAVQEAWARLDRSTPCMVVLDSWDAFIEQYLGRSEPSVDGVPAREDMERYLLSLLQSENLKTVLINESAERTHLDYLVDGICVIASEATGEHIERWLSFEKLRNVRIETANYPFTLDGARLRVFPRFPSSGATPRPPEPDRSENTSSMFPGSHDLERAFGRLQPNALTLIELDPQVPRSVHRILLYPIMTVAMRCKGRVLLVPPPTLDPQDFFVGIRDQIPVHELQNRLRILSLFPNHTMAREAPSLFISPQRITWTRKDLSMPGIPDAPFLKAAGRRPGPNLLISYLSGIEALVPSSADIRVREMFPRLARMMFGPRSTYLVGIGRSDDPDFRESTTVAAVHIRISNRRGRIVVSGKRPYTPEYVLEQDVRSPAPYSLTRLI